MGLKLWSVRRHLSASRSPSRFPDASPRPSRRLVLERAGGVLTDGRGPPQERLDVSVADTDRRVGSHEQSGCGALARPLLALSVEVVVNPRGGAIARVLVDRLHLPVGTSPGRPSPE